MGEILGGLLAGWLWVAVGRAVARRGQTGRVLTAALVAFAVMFSLMALSYVMGTPAERVATYAAVHALSVAFWLWRFSAKVEKEAIEDEGEKPSRRRG